MLSALIAFQCVKLSFAFVEFFICIYWVHVKSGVGWPLVCLCKISWNNIVGYEHKKMICKYGHFTCVSTCLNILYFL